MRDAIAVLALGFSQAGEPAAQAKAEEQIAACAGSMESLLDICAL